MKAFVFLLCWKNPVSLTVNRWLSRLHPIQGSNWKVVAIKKEKIWSPHSHSIFLVHEILVSLMILYVCNTFICQIDKYACWSIKGKRVKNLSVSLSWETSLIRSELKYSYVKTSILKIMSRITLKFITKLPNAKLMVRLKLWNCRRGKENRHKPTIKKFYSRSSFSLSGGCYFWVLAVQWSSAEITGWGRG